MRVGIDIDDVIYPWYDRAHDLCMRAGITNGVQPSTWRPFEEYGCSLEDWVAVLVAAGRDVYTLPILDADLVALDRIQHAGHDILFVTARGSFGDNGEAIKGWTREWLDEHLTGRGIPFALHFTPDKTTVPTDVFIDDRADHVAALRAKGCAAVLRDRPWNRGAHLPRVADLGEFAELVIGGAL